MNVIGKKEMDITVLTKKSVDEFIKNEHNCINCKKEINLLKHLQIFHM